jgi:hypothetical protein
MSAWAGMAGTASAAASPSRLGLMDIKKSLSFETACNAQAMLQPHEGIVKVC